jgi:hypothetical protein
MEEASVAGKIRHVRLAMVAVSTRQKAKDLPRELLRFTQRL